MLQITHSEQSIFIAIESMHVSTATVVVIIIITITALIGAICVSAKDFFPDESNWTSESHY